MLCNFPKQSQRRYEEGETYFYVPNSVSLQTALIVYIRQLGSVVYVGIVIKFFMVLRNGD